MTDLPVSGSDWNPSLMMDMERLRSTPVLRRVDSGDVIGDAAGDSPLPTGCSIRFRASLLTFTDDVITQRNNIPN